MNPPTSVSATVRWSSFEWLCDVERDSRRRASLLTGMTLAARRDRRRRPDRDEFVPLLLELQSRATSAATREERPVTAVRGAPPRMGCTNTEAPPRMEYITTGFRVVGCTSPPGSARMGYDRPLCRRRQRTEQKSERRARRAYAVGRAGCGPKDCSRWYVPSCRWRSARYPSGLHQIRELQRRGARHYQTPPR